ncbi:hypothetical protein [Streptomyces niveus]|uniref:Uncharacterized protein n=1 Tax=Streptomyces niveus TaxID=193462 RepID=A0ABZ2A3Z6_STRNV|nr:hypothetical protein [Streptomyces niveus]
MARSRNGTRNRLGVLCDQLTRHESMAAEIDTAGAGPQLRELLELVRGGAATAAEAREAELLDSIEDACVRHGLSALDVREYRDALLPEGFYQSTDGAQTAKAWVCPWGNCERVVFPEEAGASAPQCAAGGEPLRAFPAP